MRPGRRPRCGRPAAARGTSPPRAAATTSRPSGFARSLAIFATIFTGAIADRDARGRSRARTSARRRSATARRIAEQRARSRSGRGTPRRARAPRRRARSARRSRRCAGSRAAYFRMSPATKIACGQSRRACAARHRRVDAEDARLVARRGDDAARGRRRRRPPACRAARVVALLDRRVERVHVGVEDGARGHRLAVDVTPVASRHGRAWSQRRAPCTLRPGGWRSHIRGGGGRERRNAWYSRAALVRRGARRTVRRPPGGRRRLPDPLPALGRPRQARPRPRPRRRRARALVELHRAAAHAASTTWSRST